MAEEIDPDSGEYATARKHFILALLVGFVLNILVTAGVVAYVLLVFGYEFVLANLPQNVSLIVLGTIIGVVLSFWYVRELIAFFVRDPREVVDEYSLNRLRRKALNLPVAMAAIAFGVWLIFGLMIATNIMKLHPDQPLRIFVHIFMGIIFSAQVVAIYVFYFTESILSRSIVNYLMGDEKVSSLDGVVSMPISVRITLMVLTTAVFPMLHITFLNYLGESRGPTLLYATLLVFVNGVGQGIFIVRSLSDPINRIAELFVRFQHGEDVSEDVEIHRADNLGRFAEMFDDLTETIEERDFIRRTFGRYMSQQVMEEILDGDIELGGTLKEATVMFADVRDFTRFSENKPPDEVVSLLNDYLDTMVEVITNYDGVPDKFLGDGILAVWSVPADVSNHPQKAVQAAFAMLKELDRFNEERRRNGEEPLTIGMGIHTGELIAGNIGSREKMEFTVVGDTVNTCSRIEAANKELNSTISLSRTVYEQLPPALQERFRSVPNMELKGKKQRIDLYTLDESR
jgi:adenylate cyclase